MEVQPGTPRERFFMLCGLVAIVIGFLALVLSLFALAGWAFVAVLSITGLVTTGHGYFVYAILGIVLFILYRKWS